MKTRIIIILSLVVLITTSFAFTSAKKAKKEVPSQSNSTSNGKEPVGGFAMEDTL